MSTFPEPYKLADKTIAKLIRQILRRYEIVRSRLLIKGFDELNVIQQIDRLYEELDKDVRRELKRLYADRFIDVYAFALENGAARIDYIDEMAELAIAGLLSDLNPVLRYSYETEVIRKRDRAKEAINAAPGKDQKLFELKKATRMWSQMVKWFVDMAEQLADEEALRGADVQRVRWHAQKDNRVCSDCNSLDGKVFDIDHIPPKPHPGCRCYITPEPDERKSERKSTNKK